MVLGFGVPLEVVQYGKMITVYGVLRLMLTLML